MSGTLLDPSFHATVADGVADYVQRLLARKMPPELILPLAADYQHTLASTLYASFAPAPHPEVTQ